MNANHIQLFLASLFSILISSACSSDDVEKELPEPVTKGVAVEINTEVQTKAVATIDYNNGDEMIIISKAYNKLNADEFSKPTKATYQNGKWILDNPVLINDGEHAFIYGLSPWQSNIPSDLAAIPLDISRQVDILYSVRAVPVSYTTNRANLTMKHALALASINISRFNYNGEGILQQISISGDGVYSTATLNIENGKLTGTEEGILSHKEEKKIQSNGWTNSLPGIWTVPFTTKSAKVTMTLTIDGKVYQTTFPEVEMKGGYQYLFRVVLTQQGITFLADQTETVSLNNQTDEMKEAPGYGVLRIVHSSASMMVPSFWGDNVYGSIAWGDEQIENYTYNCTHKYSPSKSYEVAIETWNSTGFQLNTLEGIEIIDVSGYVTN